MCTGHGDPIGKHQPTTDALLTSDTEPDPPAPKPGLPPEIEAKLNELQLAADQFRRKIAAIEAQPEDQQFMLAMTRKLLRNTEDQIAELMQQYR